MTFKEIVDDALDRLKFDSSSATGSGARTRFKRYVNEGYKFLLSRPGMKKLRDAEVTIPLVEGTDEYVVTAANLRDIIDPDTELPLRQVSLDFIRKMDPGETSSGEPSMYTIRKSGATTFTVKFYPVPATSKDITADVVAAVTDLSADSDVPVIKAEFHPFLSKYARMCEYETSDDDKYERTKRELDDEVKRIRYSIHQTPDHIVRPGISKQRMSRHSQLGEWTPAGS
jgi:hypothetical protein